MNKVMSIVFLFFLTILITKSRKRPALALIFTF